MQTPISSTELEEVVHAATLAPSPDNNQPWLFEALPGGGLLLCHDVSRALPSDFDCMFSMIALGAALENLCVAARQHGWEPHIECCLQQGTTANIPDAVEARMDGAYSKAEPVAVIHFHAGATPDPLYPYLTERVTCRKPYRCRPVAESAIQTLENARADYPETALSWVSERASIRALAWLVAGADRIRLEYQPFHEELYRQLRFSALEAEATGDGLDVRCLELPPLGSFLLKWLRPWGRMRRLNRLGLSRLLSLPSAVLAWRTGAMGLLTTNDPSPHSYLRAGRALQRIWLTASRLGLAFHPLGSIPNFLSRLYRHGGEGLAPFHQRALERIAAKFFEIFPQVNRTGLVLLFRLGEGRKPTTRSLRKPVDERLLR